MPKKGRPYDFKNVVNSGREKRPGSKESYHNHSVNMHSAQSAELDEPIL